MSYQEDVARYKQEYCKWLIQCTAISTQIIVNVRKRKLLAALACCMHEENKKKRTCWISPLCNLRNVAGFHAAIYPTIRNMDKEFINYFRMTVTKFDELLAMIGPEITRKYSIRQPISATERLSLTLR